MSCYFRYLKDVFADAGIRVTPATKRRLDEAIHAFVGVPYKHCMPAPPTDKRRAGPDCWSNVKTALHNASRRRAFITALKRVQ